MRRKAVYTFRQMMAIWVKDKQSGRLLGGPGRFVAIDETYITKKRRNAAGFVGRLTAGHKTAILGMLEVDQVLDHLGHGTTCVGALSPCPYSCA